MRTRKIIEELENLKKELSVVSIKQVPPTEKSFLTVENYQVILNNGAIFNRQKLVKNKRDGNAVVIVPITEDNKSFVIVQPRVFTASGLGVEIPAGYIDQGETEEEAARRELREEIGCEAEQLIPLKSYNTCFLALGCRECYQQKLDRDEYIKYIKCSFNDLTYLVNAGIINDANGIIAIEEAKKVMRRLKRR